jgi:hypothetical protein
VSPFSGRKENHRRPLVETPMRALPTPTLVLVPLRLSVTRNRPSFLVHRHEKGMLGHLSSPSRRTET